MLSNANSSEGICRLAKRRAHNRDLFIFCSLILPNVVSRVDSHGRSRPKDYKINCNILMNFTLLPVPLVSLSPTSRPSYSNLVVALLLLGHPSSWTHVWARELRGSRKSSFKCKCFNPPRKVAICISYSVLFSFFLPFFIFSSFSFLETNTCDYFES